MDLEYKYGSDFSLDFRLEEWVSRKIFEHDFSEHPDILHVVPNHILRASVDGMPFQRHKGYPKRPTNNWGKGVYCGNKIDRSMERHLKNILQYLR